MTNKEYLQSLTPEELVTSSFFEKCPYGELWIEIQKNKGVNICAKREALEKMNAEDVADFVFSGKQKEICNACKLNWLSKEKE